MRKAFNRTYTEPYIIIPTRQDIGGICKECGHPYKEHTTIKFPFNKTENDIDWLCPQEYRKLKDRKRRKKS